MGISAHGKRRNDETYQLKFGRRELLEVSVISAIHKHSHTCCASPLSKQINNERGDKNEYKIQVHWMMRHRQTTGKEMSYRGANVDKATA